MELTLVIFHGLQVGAVLIFRKGEVYGMNPGSFAKNAATMELQIGSVLKGNGSLFVQLLQHYAAKVLRKRRGAIQ